MSDSNIFLDTIKEKIQNLLKDTNISVEDIKHCSYGENYTFQKDEQKASITLYFNKKGEITKILAVQNTDFSNNIINLLSVLKNRPLKEKNWEFSKDFLKEFNLDLIKKTSTSDFRILNGEELSYSIKYTIEYKEQICVILFSYNKNNVIGNVRVEKNTELGEKFIKEILK